MNIREKLLANNHIMRITLAFYDFIRLNSDWYNRLENVVSSNVKNISDYDFEYDKKLYSFFYEYIDENNVRCCVREYDSFYDSAIKYQYMLFDYSIKRKHIVKVYKCDTIATSS